MMDFENSNDNEIDDINEPPCSKKFLHAFNNLLDKALRVYGFIFYLEKNHV